MRIQTVVRRLLGLQDLRVTEVTFDDAALAVFVDVELRRSSLVCPRCHRRHRVGGYDSRPRTWRHLDLGPFEVHLRYGIRRFPCPRCRAVVTEVVPWATFDSGFTRDFEDLAAFMAQQTNKTATSRLLRIAWPTVGRIVSRTVDRHQVPLRKRRLVRIGIDEIAYRRHHKYLSLVADHDAGHVVWGGEGRSAKTLDAFFDALGPEGCASIQLASIDMSAAFFEALRRRLPNAVVVFDPFHVVKLANHATDEVRRSIMRSLRGTPDAKTVKKTRWALLKAPENLRAEEKERLATVARLNRPLYRAYLLKEALRAVYRAHPNRAAARIDAWLARASRSRLPAFVKLARTIRQHREGVLAAIQHGLSNGRLEGLNSKVRMLSHRAFGFHSAHALLALVYLCCGGANLQLPHERLRAATH
jgi:transposase